MKAHVRSATNPTAFPRKLKIAPTTLPIMARNTSAAFPASLLSVSANLPDHFFRPSLSFGGGLPTPSPSPKSHMIESTIFAIPAKRAESVEIIVIICSRIKIRTLSGKDVSLSIIFSRVCLILATCLRRFSDSVTVYLLFSIQVV